MNKKKLNSLGVVSLTIKGTKMTKDEKIKELELEIARLNGVVEGMKANPYRLYPSYPVINPQPYQQPFWYQTYCGGSTSPATVPLSGTTVTGTSYGN